MDVRRPAKAEVSDIGAEETEGNADQWVAACAVWAASFFVNR